MRFFQRINLEVAVDEIIRDCFIEWNNMRWAEISISADNHSVKSKVQWMMHNFVADVRKGGDLLKSFEQNHLVINMCSFTYKF